MLVFDILSRVGRLLVISGKIAKIVIYDKVRVNGGTTQGFQVSRI